MTRHLLHTVKTTLVLIFSPLFCSIYASSFLSEAQQEQLTDGEKNYIESSPSWMFNQIEKNFEPFVDHTITIDDLNRLYEKRADPWMLAKITIWNNEVSFESTLPSNHFCLVRVTNYITALEKIASWIPLPNTTFILSVADGFPGELDGIPLFVMCNYSETDKGILIPDFEAIANRFQVLHKKDIIKHHSPWEDKHAQLIWRGSTAYGHLMQTEETLDLNMRVALCRISQTYPDLIDAKFTILAQGSESIASLKQLTGPKVSYEDQLNYKYQLLIDGNASSYSTSGWKFFANSAVFKVDSPWEQWFYPELLPWVHYIPIRADLSDLVEKVSWAQLNDQKACDIAKNCRQFALTHLTEPYNLRYLYLTLIKYSQIFKNNKNDDS